MENIILNNDIKVFYIEADSFRMACWLRIKSYALFYWQKILWNVTPGKWENSYRAATEETEEGEVEKFNCNILIIKKGHYISITIHDYMNNMQRFQPAFQELITQPDLDPKGYCVEWYLSQKDAKCMVRLKS